MSEVGSKAFFLLFAKCGQESRRWERDWVSDVQKEQEGGSLWVKRKECDIDVCPIFNRDSAESIFRIG